MLSAHKIPQPHIVALAFDYRDPHSDGIITIPADECTLNTRRLAFFANFIVLRHRPVHWPKLLLNTNIIQQ